MHFTLIELMYRVVEEEQELRKGLRILTTLSLMRVGLLITVEGLVHVQLKEGMR